MHWAESWLEAATADRVQRNPNAMTLATVGAGSGPSARVVLCKSFVADPGYVVFYTNYESRKGIEIADNDRVAVVFHWDALGRQIRLEGVAVRSPADESDAYFLSRDHGSQLGAWGSDQSRPIDSRQAFLRQLEERAAAPGDRLATRPPHWGGYRVWADAVELWVEGKDRIHDRARWTRELRSVSGSRFAPTPWRGTRLQP